MNTECMLISFNAIATFTKELGILFSSDQRSLKLYCHLINKTTISHDTPMKKHIDAFRKFCVANREAIISKDVKKLTFNSVIYSKRVYIDFKKIFEWADKDTGIIIWEHLLTISALVDPEGKAKEILKQISSGSESNFLSNIISKVEGTVGSNSNPMEAISSIMKSGVFSEIMGSMNTGLDSGSLDIKKLMGTVQGMVSALGSSAGNQEGGGDAMSMITTMMSGMMSNGENGPQGMPDLSKLMKPMMDNLNNLPETKIEEVSGDTELNGTLDGQVNTSMKQDSDEAGGSDLEVNPTHVPPDKNDGENK
jgi:hypothetical protein